MENMCLGCGKSNCNTASIIIDKFAFLKTLNQIAGIQRIKKILKRSTHKTFMKNVNSSMFNSLFRILDLNLMSLKFPKWSSLQQKIIQVRKTTENLSKNCSIDLAGTAPLRRLLFSYGSE